MAELLAGNAVLPNLFEEGFNSIIEPTKQRKMQDLTWKGRHQKRHNQNVFQSEHSQIHWQPRAEILILENIKTLAKPNLWIADGFGFANWQPLDQPCLIVGLGGARTQMQGSAGWGSTVKGWMKPKTRMVSAFFWTSCFRRQIFSDIGQSASPIDYRFTSPFRCATRTYGWTYGSTQHLMRFFLCTIFDVSLCQWSNMYSEYSHYSPLL